MKSSPTPPIVQSSLWLYGYEVEPVAPKPLTISGKEWASPEALIASAPRRGRGQTYEAFFKSLQKWAKPLVKECEKLCGATLKRIDIEHPAKIYLGAIHEHVDQCEPINYDQKNSAHTYTEDEVGLFKNGKIDVSVATDLIFFAWSENRLPPPQVLNWMIKGFINLSEGSSADECFGIVKKRGSKKSVFYHNRKRVEDYHIASYMALLTDNGLSATNAAELLNARKEILLVKHFIEYGRPDSEIAAEWNKRDYRKADEYSGREFMQLVNEIRSEKYLMTSLRAGIRGRDSQLLSIDKIAEKWTKEWRKEFAADLDADYYKNAHYIAQRDSGALRFSSFEVIWDEIDPTYYTEGHTFPLADLKRAKSQGLKIKF